MHQRLGLGHVGIVPHRGFVDYVDQPIEIASFDLSKFDYRRPPPPDAGAAWDKVISVKFTKAGA